MIINHQSVGLIRKRRSKDRRPSFEKQQSTVVLGALLIDKQRRTVCMGNHSIHLTPTEFALLCMLTARPGEVYQRDELLQRVWGKGVYVTPRTVDVHMSKLRQKLRMSDDGLSLVETVWGIGYRLRDLHGH